MVVVHFILRVIIMEIGLIFSILYSVKQHSGIPECCLTISKKSLKASVSVCLLKVDKGREWGP